MTTDLTNHRLDHYALLERLAGNMGDVYRAWDTSLEREAAVKVLAADRVTSEADRVRFRREAQRAAQVGAHPNVVTIYGAGEASGWPYIAMEFLRGEDLGQVIEREGALAPERAVGLLEQAAAALDHLHAQNPPIIHRDVKPANFMLLPGDRLILTDFGLARRLDDTRLTQSGAVIGSPSYMAPEQVMGAGGGQPIGKAADIYSLAAMAYEMLCGRPPFSADHVHAVLHAHVALPVPSIRTVRPVLPAAVDVAMARAMAKAPAARHASASALVSDLAAALGYRRGADVGPERTPANSSPAAGHAAPGPRRGRFGGVRIALALGVLATCGFMIGCALLIGLSNMKIEPPAETLTDAIATANRAVAAAEDQADSAEERLEVAKAFSNPTDIASARSTQTAALKLLAQARATRAAARATATAGGDNWRISGGFEFGSTPSPTAR